MILYPKEVATNNNLKPIDQLLDNRKANLTEQVPALHKQCKEQKKAIRHNPELDGYGRLKAQADLKGKYGGPVVEQGHAAVHDPARFAAFPDKEAANKKADIIARREAKAGGMDEVEWTYIGPDGRINGIISGPKGRFSIKSVFAGGYDIQCLHVRVPVHKLK